MQSDTLLLVRGRDKEGGRINCQFRRRFTPSLARLCVCTVEVICVCQECYETIESHRHKPYSKIMGKAALIEAGYLVNRKLARSQCQAGFGPSSVQRNWPRCSLDRILLPQSHVLCFCDLVSRSTSLLSALFGRCFTQVPSAF